MQALASADSGAAPSAHRGVDPGADRGPAPSADRGAAWNRRAGARVRGVALVCLVAVAVLEAPPAAGQVCDPAAPPTDAERALVEAAYLCRRAPMRADPFLLLYVLRLETALAPVPPELRGWTLAQACRESGFTEVAVGDAGRAVGWIQWWPWAERYIDRSDPVASVLFLIDRALCQITGEGDCRELWKDCEPRDWREAWVLAWVRAIRSKGERCRETPRALAWLTRWHARLPEGVRSPQVAEGAADR